MVKKGVDWVDKMNTGKVPYRDAWMSFFAQLLPGINWGLVAVVLSPKVLQEEYQKLHPETDSSRCTEILFLRV